MAEQEKNVLITGASGGIGLELARIFASEGFALALVARREDLLREFAASVKNRTIIIPEDLGDPEAPQRIYDRCAAEEFPVHLLVNNAGFGTHGLFAENSLEEELNEIQVNVAALVHLTKLFVRDMLPRNQGRIMNVASVAAYPPGPLMAIYYATKAFVLSFSESLSLELSGTGITVTCLCPGPTTTGFAARAGVADSLVFRGKNMDAATVARYGYHAMMKGKRVAIPGLKTQIMAAGARYAPRSLSGRIVHRMQRRRQK